MCTENEENLYNEDLQTKEAELLDENDIVINYGPYLANGIIAYRTRRLEKLVSCLNFLGFNVRLNKYMLRNRISILMMGEEVFRGRLLSFEYADSTIPDKMLENALMLILDARARFAIAREKLSYVIYDREIERICPES